jgi:hypothetical protein
LEKAYDSGSAKSLTVDEYKQLYGPKLDHLGNPRIRPILKCLACGVMLHTVAEDIIPTVPTWGHDPSPGTYCPIKTDGATKYELLPPTIADPLTGSALRRTFFSRWQQHWAYIRDIAPYADIFTFIGFLQGANRINFWEQRHLEEWHLPYVFLSTCDFPPPKGKASSYRSEWLRFRFDGRYRTLADLWIRAAPGFTFLRLKYRKPRRNFEPSLKHFIVAEPVPADPTWLDRPYKSVSAFQVDKMKAAFPGEA